MNNHYFTRLITIIILLGLISSQISVLIPTTSLKDVHAATPNINIVMVLFRSIAALNKRNRVYAEARATTAEIKTYYDAQIVIAQRLRHERIAAAAAGDQNPQLTRAYIRAEAALE